MTYVSWATYYEGEGDAAYYDHLIPRVMEEVIGNRGVRHSDIALSPSIRLKRGSVAEVADEACRLKEAFHLVFIHADTGGRGVQVHLHSRLSAYCETMHSRCAWQPERCITIAPRHETEAWILADVVAVARALGYREPQTEWNLPDDAVQAERLSDPKKVLSNAIDQARGRRRAVGVHQLFPAIAQRQDLARLRIAQSFRAFEAQLIDALANLGCI